MWVSALSELWLLLCSKHRAQDSHSRVQEQGSAVCRTTASNTVNLKILSQKCKQSCLQLLCSEQGSEAARRVCHQPWHHCWSLALAASWSCCSGELLHIPTLLEDPSGNCWTLPGRHSLHWDLLWGLDSASSLYFSTARTNSNIFILLLLPFLPLPVDSLASILFNSSHI